MGAGTDIVLPKRLYPLRFHPVQHAWVVSAKRFNVIPAGRRSGKTETAKRKLITKALTVQCRWDDPRFFAAAPTRDQAKAIYWADLKAMIPRVLLRRPPVETELRLDIVNGAEIYVIGMDKPQRMEGRPWDGGILDEYGNMKASAFPENIRPALSDRGGWCDLIGVPEGRNHYYEQWKYAIGADDPEWAGFTWPSSDILPAAEIASAKRVLDQLVFEQEYEASFINFSGRAYYPFNEAIHCAPLKYNPKTQLILCFDFNVEPGVCAVIQEQDLPKQYAHNEKGVLMLDRPIFGTGVISEVHIPRNSNTPAVCRKIIQDYGQHTGRVFCYGDATGGARGSAKVEGSDWELIEKELRPVFRERLVMRVKSSNPSERSRLNAFNSRLRSTIGDVRLMVDAKKAPNVVKDLEGVVLLKGGSGEIDKNADPALTHISDAIGYYLEAEFPVSGAGLVKMKIGGI